MSLEEFSAKNKSSQTSKSLIARFLLPFNSQDALFCIQHLFVPCVAGIYITSDFSVVLCVITIFK